MILSKMKPTEEHSFLGEPASYAGLSLPISRTPGNKGRRDYAGFKVECIINEPSAAAMAYGIGKAMDDSTVLVFDLGGGTFDVTLALFNIDDGGIFEVKATSSDTHLGGQDFDRRVMQHFMKRIQKNHFQ